MQAIRDRSGSDRSWRSSEGGGRLAVWPRQAGWRSDLRRAAIFTIYHGTGFDYRLPIRAPRRRTWISFLFMNFIPRSEFQRQGVGNEIHPPGRRLISAQGGLASHRGFGYGAALREWGNSDFGQGEANHVRFLAAPD